MPYLKLASAASFSVFTHFYARASMRYLETTLNIEDTHAFLPRSLIGVIYTNKKAGRDSDG